MQMHLKQQIGRPDKDDTDSKTQRTAAERISRTTGRSDGGHG